MNFLVDFTLMHFITRISQLGAIWPYVAPQHVSKGTEVGGQRDSAAAKVFALHMANQE